MVVLVGGGGPFLMSEAHLYCLTTFRKAGGPREVLSEGTEEDEENDAASARTHYPSSGQLCIKWPVAKTLLP